MYFHPNTYRSTLLKSLALLLGFVCLISISSAKDTDPKDVIERDFWGKQYNQGGTTFYCQESFKGKSPLVVESYIYPEAAIRSALDCGSKRRCLRNSDKYRRIASDLHNIVPANAFFELKRRGTIFSTLEKTERETVCGMRKRMHIIEPPDDVKGDIARVIFYMHETYELPIKGNRIELEEWARNDPVSPEELERHNRIQQIQGTTSSQWLQPGATARILEKFSTTRNQESSGSI